MIMPAFVLGTGLTAVLMRQLRSSCRVWPIMYGPHAPGLSERPVISKHALRNALIPVVTVLGLQAGASLAVPSLPSKSVIPGFGKYSLDGVFSRDYAQVQAVVLITAMGYLRESPVDIAIR
jgi:peptide/nickel transport system permease protein